MLYKGLGFSFKQGLQGIVIKFLLNIKFSVLYSTRINVEGTYLTTFSWWTRVAFNFQGYLMGRVKLEVDIFGPELPTKRDSFCIPIQVKLEGSIFGTIVQY